MKNKVCIAVAVWLFCFVLVHSVQAEVDWNILKTLELAGSPVDIDVSPNGRRIFVLTKDHQLQIYSIEGTLMGQMPIGPDIDRINTMQREDIVFLSSSKDKTLQIVMVDLIHPINVSGSPFMGTEKAPVIVAVFTDFEWAYCKRLVPLLDQVIEKYPQQVKIVFKNYPIPSHKNAKWSAEAALASGEQGKFWEMHDLLFENYDKLSELKIEDLALQLELDFNKLQEDMSGIKVKKQLNQDIRDAKKAKVTGTPTVFINGRKLKQRSLDGFSKMINEELEKQKK